MSKAKTPSFILELALETSLHDEAELNAKFEVARQLYNACLDEAKRRLFLLRQSKEYQQVRNMPKTFNGKSNKERTEAFKALNAKFCFIEYDIHAYATKILTEQSSLLSLRRIKRHGTIQNVILESKQNLLNFNVNLQRTAKPCMVLLLTAF